MRKILLVALLAVLASGCDPLKALGFLKPSPGISVDAELTVGDKEETVTTDVTAGEKTVNTADNITYNVHEENKGPSVWWAAFAFLGWVLPSPRQLWIAIKSYLVGRRRT